MLAGRLPATAPSDQTDRTGEDCRSDRELAEAARTDGDAFVILYRRYVGPIYGYACRICSSREVAEDMTSATFERAWKAMPDFEWSGGGFRPWLYRIAASEIAGYYRKQQLASRPRAQMAWRDLHTEVPPELDPDVSISSVRIALAELRPRYREAITLRFLSGLSHEDAAAAMGCSKATMAVTLHRAVGALRRAMLAGPNAGGDQR
jgi:RNA polymerase sigma-70 factor (ECF subfamily)